jgi:hypothetical protein
MKAPGHAMKSRRMLEELEAAAEGSRPAADVVEAEEKALVQRFLARLLTIVDRRGTPAPSLGGCRAADAYGFGATPVGQRSGAGAARECNPGALAFPSELM